MDSKAEIEKKKGPKFVSELILGTGEEKEWFSF